MKKLFEDLRLELSGLTLLSEGFLDVLEYSLHHLYDEKIFSLIHFWMSLPTYFTNFLNLFRKVMSWNERYTKIIKAFLFEIIDCIQNDKGLALFDDQHRLLCSKDEFPYYIICVGIYVIHSLPNIDDALHLLKPILDILDNNPDIKSMVQIVPDEYYDAIIKTIFRSSLIPLLKPERLMEEFPKIASDNKKLTVKGFDYKSRPHFVLNANIIEFLIKLIYITRCSNTTLSNILGIIDYLSTEKYNLLAISASNCLSFLFKIYEEFKLNEYDKDKILDLINSFGSYNVPSDALLYWHKMMKNPNYPPALFDCLLSTVGSQTNLEYNFQTCPRIILDSIDPDTFSYILLPAVSKCKK